MASVTNQAKVHSSSIHPPSGLEALYAKCRSIYPSQLNPLQVTAIVKYWLGGPDPLDYISMYLHDGDASMNVPPHWHYISFGLSDLHGDGRVHERPEAAPVGAPSLVSGFGFELTFRLLKEPGELSPPVWPASLLQALAKYVFNSGNTLCPGDHVSWHCSLDSSESRIHHMLMCMDPQMDTVQTPLGPVNFIQIVGVTKEELQVAQHWNVAGVLEILKSLKGTGGEWLVTDIRRGESIQEIDPSVTDVIDRGIEEEGSNLSGVSAECSWAEINGDMVIETNMANDQVRALSKQSSAHPEEPRISLLESQQIKSELTRGLIVSSIKTETLDSNACDGDGEFLTTQYLSGLHLTFNLESGSLLPLCIRGRIKHGRHFTFKSLMGDTAITFVAGSVTGALVSPAAPFAAYGPWIQVLITNSLAHEMAKDLDLLSASSNSQLTLPHTFSWIPHRLLITII